MRSIYTQALQKTWDDWDDIRKRKLKDHGIILPEDFRELCRPSTDDTLCDSEWRRDHQTAARFHEIPPPLDWGAPMGGFTEVYHRPGWPDWCVSYGHSPPHALTMPAGIIRIWSGVASCRWTKVGL